MSMERERCERRPDPRVKQNRSNVSTHLSIPGHVDGIFAPAKTTNCIDDVVLATKYFNDKRIINSSKNLNQTHANTNAHNLTL